MKKESKRFEQVWEMVQQLTREDKIQLLLILAKQTDGFTEAELEKLAALEAREQEAK